MLCEVCSQSSCALLIHDDECKALARLKAAPHEDCPKPTRSLRLLMRLLLLRWRDIMTARLLVPAVPATDGGEAGSMMSVSPSRYFESCGGWWGEEDVMVDDYTDLSTLVEPPEDALTDELAAAFMATAQQVARMLYHLSCSRKELCLFEAECMLGESSLASAIGHAFSVGWPALRLGFHMRSPASYCVSQARFFLEAHARCGLLEVTSLMGALYCNSLTLYAPHEETEGACARGWATPCEVGIAVSSSVAMLNHSCEPNASWELRRGVIVVRALRPIQKDEEVCICYVDPRLPYKERARKLAEAFFFECDCPACMMRAARWCCALCGSENEASAERCQVPKCGALRAQNAMPAAGVKRARR